MPDNYDVIFIEDYEVLMSIGIYEHEKQNKQRVLVSIEARTTPNTAHHSDNIDDALSYEKFVNSITACANKQHYDLVESFAESILKALPSSEVIQSLKITIKKPDIFKDAKSAGITIFRCYS